MADQVKCHFMLGIRLVANEIGNEGEDDIIRDVDAHLVGFRRTCVVRG